MTAGAQATIDYEDSTTAHDRTQRTSHVCVACGSRAARFQHRGVVKADRSHALCFQCYRSTMDSVRNVERVTAAKIAWLRPGPMPRALERALAADKYDELARRRRRAQIAARHALEATE